MVRRVNKIFFLIAALPFGFLGFDKFIRGQFKSGIYKIIPLLAALFFNRFGGFGGNDPLVLICLLISGSWVLIDFIIACIKFGKYDKNFKFFTGFRSKHYNFHEGWSCGCDEAIGVRNNGKYCDKCGQPYDCEFWTCSKCGHEHNSGGKCKKCYSEEITLLRLPNGDSLYLQKGDWGPGDK